MLVMMLQKMSSSFLCRERPKFLHSLNGRGERLVGGITGIKAMQSYFRFVKEAYQVDVNYDSDFHLTYGQSQASISIAIAY